MHPVANMKFIEPQAKPMAIEIHIVAAVVKPVTPALRWIIDPARELTRQLNYQVSGLHIGG